MSFTQKTGPRPPGLQPATPSLWDFSLWKVVRNLALGGVLLFILGFVDLGRLPRAKEWLLYPWPLPCAILAVVGVVCVAKLHPSRSMVEAFQFRLIDLVVSVSGISLLLGVLRTQDVALVPAWLLATTGGLSYLLAMTETRQESIPQGVYLYLHGIYTMLFLIGVMALGGLLVLSIAAIFGSQGGKLLAETFGVSHPARSRDLSVLIWYFRVSLFALGIGTMGHTLLWLGARYARRSN